MPAKLFQKAKLVLDNNYILDAIFIKNLSLNTENWKRCDLIEIFPKMERGERLVKEDREKGAIPLITAGFKNEGVAEYISNKEMKRYQNVVTKSLPYSKAL